MNSLLLLTGPPGVGKTTALRRVCDALAIKPLCGFYTEEVRAGGVRQGFRLVTFDGEERTIADVRRPGAPRVGKYGVDMAAIVRSEERRVGKECTMTCRSRWSPYH